MGEPSTRGGSTPGMVNLGQEHHDLLGRNKVRGVRAAVCHDELTAALARSHNDANVLCLSADLLGQRLIEKITDAWLNAKFEGGRHMRRLHKVAAMEEGLDPSSIID